MMGAIGGTFGGLAMFGVRVIGTQTGVIIHSLPDKFERGMAEKTGFAEDQDVEQQKELAIAEHIVLSAGLGAGYGLLRGWFKPPSLPSGVVYGLVIYAMMLLGIGPSFGIIRMPNEKPPKSVTGEIFVHLLFGTVTSLVTDRLRRR
jgi:uncharacterized membrane protein YagU involved in acid resistance